MEPNQQTETWTRELVDRDAWSKRSRSTGCAGSTDRDRPREAIRLWPGGFDPGTRWRLHPQVAVRPEPFGALLYHFGTRKLSFLKNRTILAVVQSLADYPDAAPPAGRGSRRRPTGSLLARAGRAGRPPTCSVSRVIPQGRRA